MSGLFERHSSMNKVLASVGLAIGLVLAPSAAPQRQNPEAAYRDACIQQCVAQPMLGDPEVQRQEIVSLEREAARAIQQSSATFFHRVYSDDFTGTLSHGQQITKDQWIAAVVSPSVKRESFNVSDIKVRVFQETAVATCLWSSKFAINACLHQHSQRLACRFRPDHQPASRRPATLVISAPFSGLALTLLGANVTLACTFQTHARRRLDPQKA
jgi:hypothetical protein